MLIGVDGSRPRNIELKYKEDLEREVDEQRLADGLHSANQYDGRGTDGSLRREAGGGSSSKGFMAVEGTMFIRVYHSPLGFWQRA